MPISSLLVRSRPPRVESVKEAIQSMDHTTIVAVRQDVIVVLTETDDPNSRRIDARLLLQQVQSNVCIFQEIFKGHLRPDTFRLTRGSFVVNERSDAAAGETRS